MFSDFFGINEGPFKRTPDADYFYPSANHRDALLMLEYLLKSEDGFAVLEGSPGTGKSVTLRKFIGALTSNTVYAYILFPNLSPEDMFKSILTEFGVVFPADADKNGLFNIFKDFFIHIKENGGTALIIVDEAQNIPVETLEDLRILSNIETDKEKLVKIILAGQLELDSKLNSGELKQLVQRITLKHYLNELSAEECGDYINFRLRKAGKNNIQINKSMGKTIWRHTKGNPRLINTLMERTIVAAYMDGADSIKRQHLSSALKSLNMVKISETGSNFTFVATLLLAFLIAVGAGYKIYDVVKNKGDLYKLSVTSLDFNGNSDDANHNGDNSNGVNLVVTDTADSSTADGNHDSNTVYTADATEGVNGAAQDPATDMGINSNHTGGDEKILGMVNSKRLNVRANPDIQSEKLSVIFQGDTVEILEETDFWYLITLPDGTLGWVFKEYMDKLN